MYRCLRYLVVSGQVTSSAWLSCDVNRGILLITIINLMGLAFKYAVCLLC